MKFLRLNFRAFGPFTDAPLALDGESGLHIIFGPNEAGKTSALRGVRQALFGIAHNSPDDFRHPYADLRIGATIQALDGRTIEFIRRKGQKNVLRGPDDEEVLDAAALVKCLDGIDETAFSTRFALDHAELREGGALVDQSGGSLGELLFAAGGGISDLRRIEAGLRDEAEQLFVPRGKNPRLNRACNDYAETIKRAKLARLPTADWTRLQEELDAVRARSEKLETSLREQRAERDRLVRYAQALRLIANRREWQQEMAAVAGAVLLPEGFGKQHLEAMTALNHARSNEQAAAAEIADVDAALAEVHAPTTIVDHSPAIETLVHDFWAYDKAQKDRPGLISRRQLREADAVRLLRGVLQRDVNLDAEALRLTPDQKVRLQELAQERATLTTRCDGASQQVALLTAQQEQLATRLNDLPPPQDSTELERALRRAQQLGDLPKRLQELNRQRSAAEKQAAIDLQRLPLWSGDLATLEGLAIPAAATLERFEQELQSHQTEMQKLRERLAEQQAELAEVERQLAELDRQNELPSESDLAAARQRRDAGWQRVLQAWQAGGAEDSAELAATYQQSVEQADRLADRLRHEAERVSKKAALLAAQAKATRRTGDFQAQLADCEQRGEQCIARWTAVWQPLGIQPLLPREMRGWVERQVKLSAAAQQTRTQQAQADEWSAAVAAQQNELLACLQSLDRPADEKEPLPALAELADGLVAELHQRRDERAAVLLETKRVGSELPRASEALRHAANELAQCQSRWAEEMQRLSLPPQASPGQALAVLTTLDDLNEKRQEAERLRERVEGIDKDAVQFEAGARRLAQRLAPDLGQEPIERIVEQLQARLAEAREKQVRQDELRKKRDREVRRREEALAAARQAQAALTALCHLAGCAAPEELAEAEQRSTRRKAAQRELRGVGEQLLHLAAGTAIEEFVEQAERLEPEQLNARREQLDGQIETEQRQQTELQQEIGRLEEQIRQLGQGAPAAEIEEQALGLLAGIQHDAERYARLRLASAVLRRTMERYREKNQGPVLRRAGELFADLTLGSFSGLRTDFDEAGQTVVRGVRNGGTLDAQAMSDGTKDQLYLALRLASLEHYLDHHAPFPLLVDDILVHFDDQRAAAALEALAELAKRTQVLFFTHHSHLVDLATERLGGERFVAHQLDCRQPLAADAG